MHCVIDSVFANWLASYTPHGLCSSISTDSLCAYTMCISFVTCLHLSREKKCLVVCLRQWSGGYVMLFCFISFSINGCFLFGSRPNALHENVQPLVPCAFDCIACGGSLILFGVVSDGFCRYSGGLQRTAASGTDRLATLSMLRLDLMSDRRDVELKLDRHAIHGCWAIFLSKPVFERGHLVSRRMARPSRSGHSLL